MFLLERTGFELPETWMYLDSNFFELQQNLEEMIGSSESSDVPSTRRRDVDEQVFAFRTLICRKEYLLHPSDASANPVSLDWKLLSKDLLSFTEKASSLCAYYFDRFMGLAEDSDTRKMCVCVTKEEEARSFVGNMT